MGGALFNSEGLSRLGLFVFLLALSYCESKKGLKTNGFRRSYRGDQSVRYKMKLKLKKGGRTYYYNTCPCGVPDTIGGQR